MADVQNYIKTLMARTPQQMIDKRFPTYREELMGMDPTAEMIDRAPPDENDIFEILKMAEQAQEGSPAKEVSRRFPDWKDVENIDATQGSHPEGLYDDKEKALDYMTIANMGNEKGMEAFLSSGPMSENVEDRRGDSVNDFIRGYLQDQSYERPAMDPLPADPELVQSILAGLSNQLK